MLRASQTSEQIPADLARIKSDDTDRTKMLKSVMKSVAKFASTGLGKRQDESAKAAGQLIMKSAEDDQTNETVHGKERNPCEFGLLSPNQQSRFKAVADNDDYYMDLVEDDEFRAILRENARKVHAHCDSLAFDQPLPPNRMIETSIASGISLVSRHEAEGHEAEDPDTGATANHKMIERATWSWVQDHVSFQELDKMSKMVEPSPEDEYDNDELQYEKKYSELRKNFPPVHKYHAVLHYLTDHSLVDKRIWKAGMQEAMFPTIVPDVPRATLAPRGFATRMLSKTGKGGKGGGRRASIAPFNDSIGASGTIGASGMVGRGRIPAGGRLQKDRSAPTLH